MNPFKKSIPIYVFLINDKGQNEQNSDFKIITKNNENKFLL